MENKLQKDFEENLKFLKALDDNLQTLNKNLQSGYRELVLADKKGEDISDLIQKHVDMQKDYFLNETTFSKVAYHTVNTSKYVKVEDEDFRFLKDIEPSTMNLITFEDGEIKKSIPDVILAQMGEQKIDMENFKEQLRSTALYKSIVE